MLILGPAGTPGEVIHVGNPRYDETVSACRTQLVYIDPDGYPVRVEVLHDTIRSENIKVGTVIPDEVLNDPSKWP